MKPIKIFFLFLILPLLITFNNSTAQWVQVSNGMGNVSVVSLAVSGNVSNNNGTSWIQRNEGLGNALYIRAFYIFNNYIFAGTFTAGVYRRPLGELVGAHPIICPEIPTNFSLSQNYPNPFNPNTIIRFNIKDSRLTTLKVFDVLGREVATLVNEQLQPGTYEVDLDGTNYPSRIYYYKLTAGDYSETKKMVLIK